LFIISGEALIDFMARADGSYVPAVGGAPFNFARALALQGVPASYVNPLSEDPFGVLLDQALRDSGVTRLGKKSAKPTSLALVTTNEQGQPIYSFYREAVADRDLAAEGLVDAMDDTTEGFHTGGLALLPPDHEVVLSGLRRAKALRIVRTVDINFRPQVANSMGVPLKHLREAVFSVMEHADILKVSDEDLRNLGLTSEPNVAARQLLTFGAHLVVLTLGAVGAWVFGAKYEYFQRAAQLTVVDTVGAGDCFFAGFVASLSREGVLKSLRSDLSAERHLPRALSHATRCAAINISRHGCQPPSWDEAFVPTVSAL
jgi:fructokinase